MKRELAIGRVRIGGGNFPAIQSMCSTDTADIDATAAQMRRLEQAGCEIIRVAAYDINSARCIAKLKQRTRMPIVAAVHFDYKIALAAIEAGADKVRINPGNIGSKDKIRCVVDAAKSYGVPLRVGANSGSIAREYVHLEKSDALVESALENVRTLEKMGFYDIVISLKASNVPTCVRAYRKMDKLVDYPLHLGVTEAGVYDSSVIKSSMGIGALLLDGIGDTLRVTLTGDVVQEVEIAKDILRFCGLRTFGPEIISCPTCGRTRIDVERLAGEVKQLVSGMDRPIKIAVMGCAVNGPGEAADADIGIAGGRGEGLIFLKGKPYAKYPEERLMAEFARLLDKIEK